MHRSTVRIRPAAPLNLPAARGLHRRGRKRENTVGPECPDDGIPSHVLTAPSQMKTGGVAHIGWRVMEIATTRLNWETGGGSSNLVGRARFPPFPNKIANHPVCA